MANVLAVFAQFERRLIGQRTREALAVTAAMFLTGQASNPLAAKIAADTFHFPITWPLWALAGIVPGLCSLALIPWRWLT